MSDNPLCVRFGINAALIWCDDDSLGRSLTQHFRHCLGAIDHSSVVARYWITTQAHGKLHLRRDHKFLETDAEPFYIFMHLIRDVMARLATQGQPGLVFHAAGLACDQRGLILCGASDSGKSTLTARLIGAGFDYLSDELIVIRLQPYEMSGLARPLLLKEGSAFVWEQWLISEANESQLNFFNGVAWLDPELLRPDCIELKAAPTLLIFPRYTNHASLTARPLSAAETLFHLMPQLVNFENLPNRGFPPTQHLARQITAYRLIYGEATQAADWIANKLNQISS